MTRTKLIVVFMVPILITAMHGFAQPNTKIEQTSTRKAFPANTKEIKRGTIVTEHLTSEVLRDNRIGIDLKRSISVYLPQGYYESKKSYPVIYYFHSLNWSNERIMPLPARR